MDSSTSFAPEQLMRKLVDRFERTVVILLKGSHARDAAGAWSDVDFDVLVNGGDEASWPFWFEELPSDRLLHISVAVEGIDAYRRALDEPQGWAYGLGTRVACRMIYAATSELAREFDRPWLEYPPESPELEDMLEGLGKVRNAVVDGDRVGVMLGAQEVAMRAPTLLRLVNPVAWPGTRKEALEAVLTFPNAFPGYRPAMECCLGLRPDEDLLQCATTIVQGTLDLVKARADDAPVQSAVNPAELEMLLDGTIERYLGQQIG